MDTLVKNQEFFIRSSRFHFFVVGCGGNGSFLVPNLSRIIAVNNQKYNRTDKITLIDKDTVENKNITRQNFITADVGKNKAKVLASRYSKAFGVNIAYIEDYITRDNIYDIFCNNDPKSRTNHEVYVILGCVDNNATRHLLHKWYRGPAIYALTKAYIDVGNEEYAGQVVFSSQSIYAGAGALISLAGRYDRSMNDVVEEFELDDNDKHPDDLSCAERAVSAPQNIATNIKAADIVLGYCNLMIAGAAQFNEVMSMTNLTSTEEKARLKAIPKIASYMTYFDAKSGQTSVKYLPSALQSRITTIDNTYYGSN